MGVVVGVVVGVLPGRRLTEIFWGMIWMTSLWVAAEPLALRGWLAMTEVRLRGNSVNWGLHPRFWRFWRTSHLALPKSCGDNRDPGVICRSLRDEMYTVRRYLSRICDTSTYLLRTPGAAGVDQDTLLTGGGPATQTHVEA